MNRNLSLRLAALFVTFVACSQQALADLTISGTQTRGYGTNGQLKSTGVSIQNGGTIIRVNDSGAGFWLQSDKGRCLRFDKANDAVGTVLEPSTWYAYPNLPGGNSEAGVAVIIRTGDSESSNQQSSDPKRAAELRARGNEHFGAGRYREALASYDSAIKLDPGNFNSFCNRANTRGKLGQFEEAISDYNEAIRIASRPEFKEQSDSTAGVAIATAVVRRGYAKLKLGRSVDAVKDYELALRYDPANKTATQLLQEQKKSGKTSKGSAPAATPVDTPTQVSDKTSIVGNWTQHFILSLSAPQFHAKPGGIGSVERSASRGIGHTSPMVFKSDGFYDRNSEVNAGRWTRKGREIKLQGRSNDGAAWERTYVLSSDGNTLSDPGSDKLWFTRN